MDNTPENKISPHTCSGNILACVFLRLERGQSTFQEHFTPVKQSQNLKIMSTLLPLALSRLIFVNSIPVY